MAATGVKNQHLTVVPAFLILCVAVVSQSYMVHVHDEYVLLGNAGLLRCLVPSFVSDFVLVDTWVGDDGTHITHDSHHGTITQLPLVDLASPTGKSRSAALMNPIFSSMQVHLEATIHSLIFIIFLTNFFLENYDFADELNH